MEKSYRPLFSIIIPTRDRSSWLENTIQAVLEQSFKNYEIIVIDNDSNDSGNTLRVVTSAKDHRLRHIRTGGLEMAANWQVGMESAIGEYIIVCSDKLLMLPWLLKSVSELIACQKPDAVVWQIGDFSRYSDHAPMAIKTRRILGKDIWVSAVDGAWRLLMSAGARGMNSAIHRTLVKKVEITFGVPLCRMICPDYNIALSLASLNSDNLVLDEVGSVFIPDANGNGLYTLLTSNQNAIRKRFNVPELVGLPVRYITAVTAIYYDILAMNHLLSVKEKRMINWEMCYVNLIHEAINADKLGGFGSERSSELIFSISSRPFKFRLGLLKTMMQQESFNLISGKRSFIRQLSRMLRLLKYPFIGLFHAKN
jgi:glycosyltransferase involved in cell wall biosynthesis